jgi:hypothetical protein
MSLPSATPLHATTPSEAEAYLQVLRRLLPTTAHRLLFDPVIESAELLDSIQAACCLAQFEQGECEALPQLI